jgi:hypothetical protein
MAISYSLSKEDRAAVKKIEEHAGKQATKMLKGSSAKHIADDPDVKKLTDKLVEGVRGTIYQRAKAFVDKAPTNIKGDFFISGCKEDPRLRSASKPIKFDIPSTWTSKKACSRDGEEWTAKDLGL